MLPLRMSSWTLALLFVIFSMSVVSSNPSPNRAASTSAAIKSSAGKFPTGLSSLPPDAQGPISATLGKDDSDYWVHRSPKGFRGENVRHALAAEFTRTRAEVWIHNLRWGLETRSYGYGDALLPAKAVAPRATANRVEYRRDGVTEWYENGPLGLEQGFTLAHPPGKATGRALTVELALNRDLLPSLERGGRGLELRRKGGDATLRYTGLDARDATGRELRSWMEVRGEHLLLRVDDGGAHYPVVIDPWVEEAELTGSDGESGDGFGLSVAVSGSTAVIGAPWKTVGSNFFQGVAYVFVRSGGTWIQETELTSSDGASGDFFGCSVAVSGSTAVVGAPYHAVGSNGNQGAAYVFVQTSGAWTQQAELISSNGASGDELGSSVALSGSTAVVGSPEKTIGSNTEQGAAYVFVESGGKWGQQAELTSSDGAFFDQFGVSVADSGSTAVIGAPWKTVDSNEEQGAAYVFVQTSGTWIQETELTSSDGASGDLFGYSVAISGSTAMVGAYNHNLVTGAVYVFVESGGTWSQQAELTASDGGTNAEFGWSVAVSGSTAVVGAVNNTVGSNTHEGTAYVFVESGGTWGQQAELTSSDGATNDNFGGSVAVSGSTVIAGASGHQFNLGAAYVFVPPVTSVLISPTSLSFGKQAINTISGAKTVALKNTGGATLDINRITASGDFAIYANTCGATLAVGKTCEVKVTFAPAELGPLTGTLTFFNDGSDSPQTVALTGTGTTLRLAPASWNFGSVAVGQTSSPKTFVLTNQSGSTVRSISVSLAGTDPSDFTVSNTNCGSTLAGNSSCSITVVLHPQMEGTVNATLKVSSTGVGSPQTASLTGTGT
jgi:hypothetical protein